MGMACIVETFSGQYIASSLLPLSTNSLCCGSNTSGVHIARKDKEIERSIALLMRKLNFKRHKVIQIQDNQKVDIGLPYNVEIHRSEKKLVVNKPVNLLIKFTKDGYLRQEATSAYCSENAAITFESYTWKHPVKCDECSEFIKEYDYYSYEKHKLRDKRGDKFQYLCCLSCYAKLFPSRRFKVPFARIIRTTLPLSLRQSHWKNAATGEVLYQAPDKRVPLNPNAFSSLAATTDQADKLTLVSLLSRLKGTVIDEFIKELDAMENFTLIDAEHLATLAHSKGINIRLLGKLTFAPESNYVREIAVVLILSRAVKHLVLNALAKAETGNSKEIIISYLNHLLSVSGSVVCKRAWEQLSEYVRVHWNVLIDHSALGRIHMPSVGIAVCRQLGIAFSSLFEVSYQSLAPFSESSLVVLPTVVDKPYISQALELIKGKIQEAHVRHDQLLHLIEEEVKIGESIYKENSMRYADTLLDYANHLHSLHKQMPKEFAEYEIKVIDSFERALSIFRKAEFGYSGRLKCLLGLASTVPDVTAA